jgi:hypothetical protein
MKLRILFSMLVMAAFPLIAAERSGFGLSVLVDDCVRPEFARDSTIYVEAVRGSEFAIRLTNPMPYRVAFALSVDGLNTIDAKHTDPWKATKWVLDPYESTVISGWQVSGSTARRFFFTGEKHSYGAALGQTSNLGVIEAVVYRERPRIVYEEPQYSAPPCASCDRNESSTQGAPAARDSKAAPRAPASDEYVATGMGDREHHDVTRVAVDLDPQPMASFRIRYEFRPQLVALGIIPPSERAIDRRERAHGFDGWCPVP